MLMTSQVTGLVVVSLVCSVELRSRVCMTSCVHLSKRKSRRAHYLFGLRARLLRGMVTVFLLSKRLHDREAPTF